MKIEKNSVCVFDLDDTLYNEVDFHTSGIRVVAREIKNSFGYDIIDFFETLTISDDYFQKACETLGIDPNNKESFLWIYRNHRPEVTLDIRVRKVLNKIENHTSKIAILTDGRSITQRNKLVALGLDKYPCYISDEYGHGMSKPDLCRFELIMKSFRSKQYIYVGDNPKKDFIAPNKLGWLSIMIRDSGRNIHSQDIELTTIQKPKLTIKNIIELEELLC